MPESPGVSLIRICPVCGGRIPREAPGGHCPACLLRLATLGGDEDEPNPDLLDAGQVRDFGDYELIEEIARGGMGVVYRAWQRSAGREVAVKMILAGQLATPAAVARFRNEAAAAAKLDHPNIVPVYELGEIEAQHFFSMAFVPGKRDIARWARQLPDERRFQAIALALSEVARAVDYAHQRGVLHRDLKPSNILIDENDEPQVTDFGLAKVFDDPDLPALTASTAIIGSPSYMAPEQAEPRGHEVTTATDVYGLGAVLYELLSGRPPFTGATPLIIARRVVEEPARRIAEVPEDLDIIARKCLAKAPAQRYHSALALAEDLERFARGEAVAAQPESTFSMVVLWARHKPVAASLALALILTLFVGFIAVFWQWRHAERARREATVANQQLHASNARLSQTVARLEWRRIVQLLDSGDNATGMAQLARLLRANPFDPRAASLAISVLEQRGFATPAAPLLSHGREFVVTQARMSPDGKRIVTAGSDGTARLWDAATSQPLGAFMPHEGPVRWVEFSADGTRIATASDDRTARLWDGRTGAPLTPPLRHEGPVAMLAFSPAMLATISGDGTARVWLGPSEALQLPLGAPGHALAWSPDGSRLFTASSAGVQGWTMEGRELFAQPVAGGVDGLALSPDGGRLAGWSEKGLRVWFASTGVETGVKFEEMSGLRDAAWSPDGARLAAGATNSWARVWDASTGRAMTPRLSHLYICSSVLFSPDGRTLISGGFDGASRRWDIATGTTAAAPLLHRDAVISSRFSPDGSHLLVVAHPWNHRAIPRGGTAQLWDLRPRGRRPWRQRSDGTSASTVAWSADGMRWATAAVSGSVHLHGYGRPDVTLADSKTEGWRRGLAFLAGDRHVSVVSNRGEIGVWSVESGQRTGGPWWAGSSIEASRVFPDFRRIAIGETSGAVSVWDLETGAVLARLPTHRSPLNAIDVSPDGRWVASGGEDGMGVVSDASTGAPRFPPIQLEDEIVAIRFSPDGESIITASHDHTGRVWDARTGAPRTPPLQVDGEVAYAEFDPAGTRVLTADRAGMVRVWDVTTGYPVTEPLRHNTALRGASFSPDGTRLVTEDHEGLRLWDTASGEPLTLVQPHRTGIGIGFDTQGMHVLFSPDGQSALHGTATADFLRWDFPVPPTPAPAWLPELLEAIAALSVSDTSALAPVSPETWFALQERLRALPGEDFYARWARAYCGGLR